MPRLDITTDDMTKAIKELGDAVKSLAGARDVEGDEVVTSDIH
jgi:hypothetical protein